MGIDFFSLGRMLNKKCFMIYACKTDCKPLLAFFGDRKPYGCSFLRRPVEFAIFSENIVGKE